MAHLSGGVDQTMPAPSWPGEFLCLDDLLVDNGMERSTAPASVLGLSSSCARPPVFSPGLEVKPLEPTSLSSLQESHAWSQSQWQPQAQLCIAPAHGQDPSSYASTATHGSLPCTPAAAFDHFRESSDSPYSLSADLRLPFNSRHPASDNQLARRDSSPQGFHEPPTPVGTAAVCRLPVLRPRATRPAQDSAIAACSLDIEEDLEATSAGSPPPRGKRGAPRTVLETSRASVTSRNRERQQRFRRRQKSKIADLEAQVSTLAAQSECMDTERTSFNTRIDTLTGALALRDQQLMDVNTRLAQAQQQLQQQRDRLQTGSFEEPENCSTALTLTLQSEPIKISSKELQNITGAEFARWWKEYVRQLAVLLVSEEPDGRLSPAVTNRISQLTAEQLALMRHVWVSSSAAHELFQAKGKMEEVTMPWEENGNQRWHKLTRALDLSHTQRLSIIELRSHLCSRLKAIREERRTITRSLLDSLEASCATGRDVAIQRFKANKNVDVLKEGLQQENLLIREFVSCMYQQVFTPVQMARSMVQSYPWYPDCQGIANWVAADSGDQEAAELLQMSQTSDSIFDEHMA